MKMKSILEEMASDAKKAKPGIKSLHDKISDIASGIGSYNYVVYLGSGKDKISIGTFKELQPYAAQVIGSGKIKVSFTAPERTQVTFTNDIENGFEDRDSYEKHGGLIYIFEPMTNKIAAEIMKKVDRFRQ